MAKQQNKEIIQSQLNDLIIDHLSKLGLSKSAALVKVIISSWVTPFHRMN